MKLVMVEVMGCECFWKPRFDGSGPRSLIESFILEHLAPVVVGPLVMRYLHQRLLN